MSSEITASTYACLKMAPWRNFLGSDRRINRASIVLTLSGFVRRSDQRCCVKALDKAAIRNMWKAAEKQFETAVV